MERPGGRRWGSFICGDRLADEFLPFLEGFALRHVAHRERDKEVFLFRKTGIFKRGYQLVLVGRDEELAIGDEGDHAFVDVVGVAFDAFDDLGGIDFARFLLAGPASGHPVENLEAFTAFELL